MFSSMVSDVTCENNEARHIRRGYVHWVSERPVRLGESILTATIAWEQGNRAAGEVQVRPGGERAEKGVISHCAGG